MLNLKSLFSALCLSFFISSALAAGNHIVLKQKKAKFEDIKQNITEALTGRGLVVNNTSHIGEMLGRTGKDLGGAKQIYLKAEAIEFCSATVSRATMEADPTNIIFCPYIIAVYVLPKEPGTVYTAYRKPSLVGSKASKESLRGVEKLLGEIVTEALQ